METERLGARGTWIERFRRLLDRIDGEILGDPRFGASLAKRALRLTSNAPEPFAYEAAWRALGVYGGALRASERYAEARAMLFASWAALQSKPEVAKEDEAELCGRLAFFFRDVREAEDAKAMAARKVELAVDPKTRAKALVDSCLVAWDAGDTDWSRFRESGLNVLRSLDHHEEPAYYRTALQMFLVASAEDDEAQNLELAVWLKEYCAFEKAPPGSVGFATRNWVVGLVLRRLGRIEGARQALNDAQRTYLGVGNLEHAATAVMDLAILELAQGRNDEVVRLAGKLFPIFGSLRYRNREAWSSLTLFCRAALDGSLTLHAAKRYRARFMQT